jgi:hypothetical protein
MSRDLYALDKTEGWKNTSEALPFIRAIFPHDPEFQNFVFQSLENLGTDMLSGLGALIGALKNTLEQGLKTTIPEEQNVFTARLKMVNEYHARLEKNAACYRPANPGIIFWPDPTRAKNPKSIYETYPVVKNLGIVDSSTPISSAGSCFAYEIAYSFQRRGFNYVVTEPATELENGILSFHRNHEGEDKKYPRFSANWGLLFNTANLRQLAERAFGVRELPKILSKVSTPVEQLRAFGLEVRGNEDAQVPLWFDPFREDVIFLSPEAYEKNYPIHTAKCREALTKAKVFIATMGLVEAWEIVEDGSIISYNPQSTFPLVALTRPKLLSVKENVENMQKFIDIIRKHNPEMQFIFTLSPISLLATFRHEDQHVVTADGFSKANLRIAIEEVVNSNEGVHYFPSYEYVNRCVKDPWDADERHVKEETVKGVMRLFDKMFVKPS